jgi:hypothetical protein
MHPRWKIQPRREHRRARLCYLRAICRAKDPRWLTHAFFLGRGADAQVGRTGTVIRAITHGDRDGYHSPQYE